MTIMQPHTSGNGRVKLTTKLKFLGAIVAESLFHPFGTSTVQIEGDRIKVIRSPRAETESTDNSGLRR